MDIAGTMIHTASAAASSVFWNPVISSYRMPARTGVSLPMTNGLAKSVIERTKHKMKVRISPGCESGSVT